MMKIKINEKYIFYYNSDIFVNIKYNMEKEDIIIENQVEHFEGGETDDSTKRKGSESAMTPDTLNY